MPDKNQTPEEHSSIVGGSTAARRLHCPRSYALEQLAPPDKGSSYAREGTALHEMIAVVLATGAEPDELLPFTFSRETHGAEEAWSLTVDADLWFRLGQPALDALDDFIDEIEAETGGEFTMLVEKRCAMPGIPGGFGTADVVWRCGEMSGVWDWKFGRTPVAAEANSQFMFYGRAAAASHPEMFGAKTWGEIDPAREVVLSVMQPACSDDPDDYVVNVAELEAFRVELVAAVAEAQQPDARCEKGTWCQFASCKSVCPEHVGQTVEMGKKMAAFTQGHPKEATLVGDKAFVAALPDLLELAETAQAFAKTVFAQAHTYADGGGTLAGWELKAKRSAGRNFVSTEDEVKTYMKNRRYKFEDYMPRKMLSVPQIEKLLKKDGRTLPDEMFEKTPSSGTTLVREGGPSPTVSSTPERMSALGDKLARFTRETTDGSPSIENQTKTESEKA